MSLQASRVSSVIGILLDLSILLVAWSHIFAAPYNKVEESFNLHATHDILAYGLTPKALPHYDHFVFPGVVPRTFIGSLVLAAGSYLPLRICTAFGIIQSKLGVQLLMRLCLATGNVYGLILIRRAVERRFGRGTSALFTLLTCTQFHLPFWIGRTLPNMFALLPVNMATSLYVHPGSTPITIRRHYRIILCFFGATAIIFRSELILLFLPTLPLVLFRYSVPPRFLIPMGLTFAIGSLASTLIIDSYFWNEWRSFVWPELSGILFNVYEGKSSEWGTTPLFTFRHSPLTSLITNVNYFAISNCARLGSHFPATSFPRDEQTNYATPSPMQKDLSIAGILLARLDRAAIMHLISNIIAYMPSRPLLDSWSDDSRLVRRDIPVSSFAREPFAFPLDLSLSPQGTFDSWGSLSNMCKVLGMIHALAFVRSLTTFLSTPTQISPWHTYLTQHLPKLLLGSTPLALYACAPTALERTLLKTNDKANSPHSPSIVRELLTPYVAFVLLISGLGHKEWRFVVYVVPMINVAAAIGAKRLLSFPSGPLRVLGRLAVFGLVGCNITATLLLTAISRTNYPGGHALALINSLPPSSSNSRTSVWIDNLAAQTGASLFTQAHSPPYFNNNNDPNPVSYDDFTYLVVEDPSAHPIEKWDFVGASKGFRRWILSD
ncbi:Alg9-like mannosyltransferase family [Rhizoctonia solani]|uniref:Mannosyltransferase n=1 Tax=Rhizoctonia solani TaxID=456999 RepID=A0A8H7I9T8_9AGAM|nr:Alg9-like mannosyltransferase family [Rhizoctonia solani]